MPKRLLIVAHAPSENTLALRQAVERGALGETDIEEYQRKGNDEISVLAASFNRMRRSLDSAMSMLER